MPLCSGQKIGLSTRSYTRSRSAPSSTMSARSASGECVLIKPDPLDDDEWALMRRHPEIGERICQPLNGFKVFGPIIRHHHERWDGRGY